MTQAQVNPQTNFTEINGGWQLYPVAYLPGQSTMEISMTSAQFDADMFAMANNVDFASDATYTTFVTETVTPDSTTHKAELTNTAVANSIQIAGLTQDTTAAAGKFSVEDIPESGTEPNVIPAHTELTFSADETGAMEVTYEVAVTSVQKIDVDNMQAAVGEVVCKWPVYPSSDDCTKARVKGYVVLKMYRARVTAMPGFDTSLTYRFPAQQCA